MSALKETLSDLRDVFSNLDLDWYVFGAQALNLHGFPRMTADIDVTITPPSDFDVFIETLQDYGFRVRVDDAQKFARISAVLPVLSANNLPVDIVFGRSGLERHFFERASLIKVGELEIPVATAEDLIVSKLLAGRPKDLEDIRHLKRKSDLDLDYIHSTLAELEEALGVSDLIPLFERL